MDEARWGLLETFLAVAGAGSLGKAARRLGVSQSTLSRQLRALEEALGFALFDRRAHGLALTPAGAAMRASAEAVGRQVDGFFREAVGLRERVGGTVRVTLPEVAAGALLAPWVAHLSRAHPAVSLDWVVTNELSNLLAREADVALRIASVGQQQDLIARRAGALEMGFYASRGYVAARGLPADIQALRRDHPLIGYDRDEAFIRNAAKLGERFTRADFAFRSDSTNAQLEAIRAGVGVGVTLCCLAARDPDLVRVLPGLSAASLEVWVVAHRDVRSNGAVRLVFDNLFDEAQALCRGVQRDLNR